MKIFFRDKEDKGREFVTIGLPYAVDFGYKDKASVAEYKDEVMEVLGLEVRSIYEIIDLLATLLITSDDYREGDIAEHIKTLTAIGKSFQEGIDVVRENFEEENAKEFKAKSKNVLDLSAHPENLNINSVADLAKQLSAIMNNPLTPEVLKENLKTALVDTFNSGKFDQTEWLEFEQSPKYIEMLFNGFSNGGAE